MTMQADSDIDTDLDADADLTAADRGDDFVPDDAPAPKRDADGKFAKAEEDDEDAAKVAADLAAAAALADPEAVAAAALAAEEAEAAAAEAAAEAAADPDNKNLGVRLNKMREQRDADRARADDLAARLAALESKAVKPDVPAVDPMVEINAKLDELYEKVEEARADGNVKDAAALQRQIDAANRQIVTLEAKNIAVEVSSASNENSRYDAMLDIIERGVAAINPKDAGFDQSQVKEMEFNVSAYEKMGLSPTAALRKASSMLFGFDPLAPVAAKAEVKAEATKPAAPAAKKADPAKAVDTQKRQPPDVSDRGNNNDSTTIDVNNLSDDEYAALPESKKAQMRGDFVGA